MKIAEITSKLFENDQNDLENEINDFLIMNKAQGNETIKTIELLNNLKKMGYTISEESLLELLQNNPIVTNADNEQINLGNQEEQKDSEEAEQKVGDMAVKSAQDEIEKIGEI